MQELTLESLPQYAESDPKLVTALFAIAKVAQIYDELAAPKAIDVWIARDIMELNAFSDRTIPVMKLDDLPYHLYIATTEVSQSYVLVPSTKRLQAVTGRLQSGICV